MRKKIILTGMVMAGLVIGMAGMASAASMTVDIKGEVDSSYFSNTTVKVGDTFRLTFSYDDSLLDYRPNSYYANGRYYSKTIQPIYAELAGWYGTLPEEIIDNSIGTLMVSGSVVSTYKYSNYTGFHSKEWNFSIGSGSFKLITDYFGSNYGWWAVGSAAYGAITPNTLDMGTCDITGLSIAPTPVPVPATILLFATGLAGLAGFRKKSRRRMPLAEKVSLDWYWKCQMETKIFP